MFTTEVTALNGLASERKLGIILGFCSSLKSVLDFDSRRLREEGLRPGARGSVFSASTVLLLLKPGGPGSGGLPGCLGWRLVSSSGCLQRENVIKLK